MSISLKAVGLKKIIVLTLISGVTLKGDPMSRVGFWSPFHDDDFFDLEMRHIASAANIYDKNGFKVIEMHVPGMKLENISVVVDGNTIEISGSHEEKKEEEKGRNYYRKEIKSGSFSRRFNFGFTIPIDKVKAEVESGVLKVSFPSNGIDETTKKKIAVTEK